MPSSREKTLSFEGADYSLDIDQKALRSMKRKMGTTFGEDGAKFDETYIEIVNLLGFIHETKMQDKDDDPTYALFLEYLEEDSNSYVLNVALSHGVFSPIKYEARDDRCDKSKRQTPRSSSSSLQGSRSLHANNDLESDMENFGALKEDMLIHRRSSSSMGAKLKSGPKRCHSEKDSTQMNAWRTENPLGKSSVDIGHSSDRDPRADSVAEPYKVLTSGLKVKGESVVYKCGDGKQVHFEENDQHKSTHVQNEPSKRVHGAQISSSRPPVPAPTPRVATPTMKAPTPTSKFRDKVGNRSSTATQISTKPLNQSATPTKHQTPRAASSTCTSVPRVSVGCSLGRDHRSNSRAPASSESVSVFVCGLAANREAVSQRYGDGKPGYYEGIYKQRPTYVQNEPLETGSTLRPPTLKPPIRDPGLSEPNSVPKMPNPMNAPAPRPLAKKDHRVVQSEKAQILNSRPPTPSPSQRAVRDPGLSERNSVPKTPNPVNAPALQPIAKKDHRAAQIEKAQILNSRPPTPSLSQRAFYPSPKAPTSSPSLVTSSSLQNGRCDMSGNLSETLNNKRNAARRSRDWFSEELERICQQPYRQKDYEDLLEKVSVRKPMEVRKGIRGREYSVPGEMGKSYLDSYTDLAEEIKKVKSDPKKVLNLLRGFFFFLQHLPHGIPIPWKHAPWMEIMLGST